MSSSPTQLSPDESESLLLQENVQDLARIIASEARGVNETEQTMVGWTVVNRMKNQYFQRVSDVWLNGNYAHNSPPTYTSLRIAEGILTGTIPDISQGATHFYSPSAMPKKGETIHHGMDVDGGLESVMGVFKNGKPVENYRPLWAKRYFRINIPGVQEKDFKFYRAS